MQQLKEDSAIQDEEATEREIARIEKMETRYTAEESKQELKVTEESVRLEVEKTARDEQASR